MAKLEEIIMRDTRANQPSAGIEGRLYFVTDELVLERDSGSTWESIEFVDNKKSQVIFTVEGDAAVSTGALSIGNHTGRTLTIDGVYMKAGTAPAGASLIVDINKDGTTLFTTQANRPAIASGATSGNSTTLDITSWSNGTYLTMDVDQIGSTTAGADISIVVVYH